MQGLNKYRSQDKVLAGFIHCVVEQLLAFIIGLQGAHRDSSLRRKQFVIIFRSVFHLRLSRGYISAMNRYLNSLLVFQQNFLSHL